MEPALDGFRRTALAARASDRGVIPEVTSGGRARRLATAVASNGLSQVLGASQALLLLPLFLRAWGAEEYGRWLALSAGVYYLALLDFGGQSYIGNLLAIAHARDDERSFRARLSEGLSLFLGVSLAAWVVVSSSLLLLKDRLASTSAPGAEPNDAAWILFALSTTLLITVPTGVYATVYRATGRFTRGAMISNVFRALELGLFASILALRCTPLQYAMATLGATMLRAIVIVRDIRRTVPEARGIEVSTRSAWLGRAHAHGSLLFWLYSLATGINQQGILLALAATAGPVAVAAFATHRTVAGLVSYVPTLFNGPLQPELSRLWAMGRRQDLTRLALETVRLVMTASGVLSVLLFMIMPMIYPWWTGKHLSMNSTLLIVLLAQAVLAAGWSTSAWAPLAGNKHRAIALWSMANAALTVAGTLALAPHLGALGAAIATIGADVLCGLAVYPVLAARFLEVPGRAVAKAFLAPVLMTLVPSLLLAAAYTRLEGSAMLVAMCAVLLAWLFPAWLLAQRSLATLRLRQAA
jgi:O-antigen/teichoic acid export membrane protein